MASIQKRTFKGGTSYRVQIRKRGFEPETATFSKLTDARAWSRKVEAAMDEGRFFPERQARDRTLADLVDRYTNREKRDNGRLGGNPAFAKNLSAQERQTRIRQLERWTRLLGNPTLDRVTRQTIQDGRTRIVEGDGASGRPISGATANRYLAALRATLAFAVDEGWMRHNPARGIKSLKETPRKEFLSAEQQQALLSVADASDESRLYPLVLLAIASGGRRGELLRLRWRDVDVDAGTVRFLETKNDEPRAVGVAPEILREIRQRLGSVRVADPALDFVFASRPGRRPVFPESQWRKAREASGLDHLRFHDLRHTFASNLAKSGASLAELAEALGHKTLAMVKRYSHLTEGHVANVTRKASEGLL